MCINVPFEFEQLEEGVNGCAFSFESVCEVYLALQPTNRSPPNTNYLDLACNGFIRVITALSQC